ncbi:DUF167 domain-containing protein [Pseudobdellovibrio sp. HCB154]|uniref:DUF167 domain-containing protein n=1 Tax=Pseudobdellovibrio sp. HCB154 TaxID=3386277 RepID=UPI003916DA8E
MLKIDHLSPKCQAKKMKITVAVKPNSKKELVEQQPDGSYVVRVNVPPVEGRANERVIELLSEHFRLPKSLIALVGGQKSKKKIFSIGSK